MIRDRNDSETAIDAVSPGRFEMSSRVKSAQKLTKLKTLGVVASNIASDRFTQAGSMLKDGSPDHDSGLPSG